MTEEQIRLLGFQIQHDDGGGYFDKYHYYTYKITEGLSFITNASDETLDGSWFVEFFNTDAAIRFTEFAEVQALINLLEKRRIS